MSWTGCSISASALALILATGLCGCSSEVKMADISGPPPKPGVEFSGIPVRFPAQHVVEVYALQSDGTYALVHTDEFDLPDQSQLFALHVDACALSDHTLALELNPNGTPKKIKTTSSSKSDEALTQVGASMSSVSTAIATLEQKRLEAEAAEKKRGGDQIASREKVYLDFREAVEEALRQQAKVNALPSSVLDADRFSEESKLRVMKLKANQAARRAGESPPFPDEDTLP